MREKRKYTHVIWDWNGTLFDDVDWCISVINSMLERRQIKILSGLEDYHNAFCFPVVKYYQNVGFDFTKEPFEALAIEYMALYHANRSGGCKLHINTIPTLNALREKNISQILLSASETGNLISQMSVFEIEHFFDEILGLSNIYAASKIDIGRDFMIRRQVDAAVLVGDTTHDFEVANALGLDCILVASGHQSRTKLLECNVPVVSDISHVMEYFE